MIAMIGHRLVRNHFSQWDYAMCMYSWCAYACLQYPSNQSFCRQIAGYGMSMGDHDVD